MNRTTLTPAQTAWLTATFDRNRTAFGGARMVATDGEPEKAAADADAGEAGKAAAKGDGKASGDEALGEGGKRALEAERDARKAAEDQVKALKGEFDGFKTALTTALGIKPDEGNKGQDALTVVQDQLAAMQRESAVLRLANEHKITDAEDLEILATAKDADSMKKLAERLAPKEQERDAKSRTPKPDRSQGGGSGNGKPNATSVAQVMADRAAARASKN